MVTLPYPDPSILAKIIAQRTMNKFRMPWPRILFVVLEALLLFLLQKTVTQAKAMPTPLLAVKGVMVTML
jgi:hypothetical protein